MKYSDDQKRVIAHKKGHAIVMAPPGSGKTTTMVGRILSLLSLGADPSGIVVLMFNKKASEEFSTKLTEKAGYDFHRLPDVKTYHAIGYAICEYLERRGHMEKAKLEVSDKILEFMSSDIIKKIVGFECFKELQNKNSKIVEVFISYVDMIKSQLLPAKEVFENMELSDDLAFFPRAFDAFEKERKSRKIRFFSDLLYDPVVLIKSDKKLLDLLSNKKDYIIVDEYQDTNNCQSELLKIMAGDRAEVMVVGDVDQAIYEWRGGDPELMLTQFSQDFKNPVEYELAHTFRYGHTIALMSNHVITRNENRHDTLCQSHESTPKTNAAIWSTDDYGEATYNAIKERQEEGVKNEDIVVLVRSFSQALPVELSLLKNGVGCKIEGGSSALESKEVKGLVSLLELANGDFKNMSEKEREDRFSRLLRFPNIGVKSDIIDIIAKNLSTLDGNYGFLMRMMDLRDVSGFQRKKIGDRSRIFEKLERSKIRGGLSAYQLMNMYLRDSELVEGLKYIAMTKMEFTESRDKCLAFLDFVKINNGSPSDLISLIGRLKEPVEGSGTQPIVITSIHRSKGLEWDTVIMPGLIEGKFPGEQALNNIRDMESERRLFYVGITRAINMLYMITPECSRMDAAVAMGTFNREGSPVSRFVFESSFNLSQRVSMMIREKENSYLKNPDDRTKIVDRYLSGV